MNVEPVEFSNWSAVECIDVDSNTSNSQSQTRTTVQLTDSELRLLTAIVNNPMLASSDYVKLAKVSPNTLAKLRPVFIEKGFIAEHTVDSSTRGRSKRIWEPLEAAKQAVQENTV